MIDLLFGIIIGGALVFAYFHFKGESPAKALTDLTSIEARIKLAMSQIMDEAIAKAATAVEAAKAAAVEAYRANNPPVDPAAAATEQETADAAQVEAFAASIAPAPAAPVEG